MAWRKSVLLMSCAAVLLTVLVSVLFQDNIARYLINPKSPYQLYTPPPPPAYGARGAWALWPDDPNKGDADVFYIHSTTYASSKHWNAPITNQDANIVLTRVTAPNEAGPFLRIGAVYGPRYRQATLFAEFTHKFDGLAARRLAYGDVEQAFDVFLKRRREDLPFIIVGYGQGGLYGLGLLQYRIAGDEALRKKLVAAYIIRTPTPLRLFSGELSEIPPCAEPTQTGCVISYIDIEPGLKAERRRFRSRALIWTPEGALTSVAREPILCVNPISWRLDAKRAPKRDHLGAASATGLRLRETPPAIARAISAQCVNGILQVDTPSQSFLRRRHWFGDHWREQHFNLFFHDLAADATRRTQQFNAEKNDA